MEWRISRGVAVLGIAGAFALGLAVSQMGGTHVRAADEGPAVEAAASGSGLISPETLRLQLAFQMAERAVHSRTANWNEDNTRAEAKFISDLATAMREGPRGK